MSKPTTRRRPRPYASSQYRTTCGLCHHGIYTSDPTMWVRRHGPGLITGLAHTTCADQHKGGGQP